MNLIKRLFFKKVLRNILDSHGLLTSESKIKVLWFKDGFQVKHIRLKMNREQMERGILSIVNDQPGPGVNYNSIRVRNDSLYITLENYFSCGKFNLTKTDLRSKAVPWNAKKEIQSSNCTFIIGQSGSGKTTLTQELVKHFPDYEILLYSLKTEDFPDGVCKGFEPENLEELLIFLEKLKEDRNEMNKKRLLIIDEFFVLSRIGDVGPKISKHISDILPYCRSRNFKIILLSQTLNKTKLKDFSLDLVNLRLISLPEIGLYQESLGHLPGRFLIKLKRGQFIKFSMDEEPMVVSHNL